MIVHITGTTTWLEIQSWNSLQVCLRMRLRAELDY
jgi:hypothetical protein